MYIQELIPRRAMDHLIKHILFTNRHLFAGKKAAIEKLKQTLRNIINSLNPADMRIVLDNPHISQVLFRKGVLDLKEMPFLREIPDDLPRLTYYDRYNEINTNIHMGQIKLLLSEIEFLTLHGHVSQHVLYIGAGPGFHIPLLAKMFSRHVFYLYDTAFTDISHLSHLIDQKRVFVYKEYFLFNTKPTTWDTFRFNHPEAVKPLFISDIRRDIDQRDMKKSNIIITEDMELQKSIVKQINPPVSLLKFRLPWDDLDIEYFDGTRYFGVYAKQQSTETRLVVTDVNSSKIYNGKKNEEQLFYFNVIMRPSLYRHPKVSSNRIDHCYDCTAEMHILNEYLKIANNNFERTKDKITLDYLVKKIRA